MIPSAGSVVGIEHSKPLQANDVVVLQPAQQVHFPAELLVPQCLFIGIRILLHEGLSLDSELEYLENARVCERMRVCVHARVGACVHV